MKISVSSGAVLAAAAAALVVGGSIPSANAASNYKVKCFGQNACKGHGGCKSLSNACKGKNACKGQGFTMKSKSACTASGGSTTKG
jgi:hypothetical protein